PTVSGTVNVIGNAPSWSGGSVPPVHSATVFPDPSSLALAVQPSTSPATAPVRGAWMATSTVGEPSQPWVGFRLSVATLPAGTATRSASVCAPAGDAETTTPNTSERTKAEAAMGRYRRVVMASMVAPAPAVAATSYPVSTSRTRSTNVDGTG